MVEPALLLFMATVQSLYRKLKAMNTNQVILNVMTETTGDLTEENKKQLLAGYNKLGFKIGDIKPYESSAYAFYKANRNPLPGLGNPDLFDTGEWSREITTNVSGQYVKTISADAKNAALTLKYKGILGLGGDFQKEYVDTKLRPAFRKEIKKNIGL